MKWNFIFTVAETGGFCVESVRNGGIRARYLRVGGMGHVSFLAISHSDIAKMVNLPIVYIIWHMANKNRYTKREIRKAIEGSKGIKTAIAQRLNCTRQTVDNYLDRFPDLKALVSDERDSIIDLAEVKLLQAVNNNDMRAILFVLETIGKDRGWTKRTEITGADGGAVLELPPEALRLLKVMDIEPSDVVREFVAMLEAEAEKAELE